MPTLTSAQDQEVTFESGIAANGTLAAQSFWTWNGDDPATYGAVDYEAKYGASVAGSDSGAITYSFAAASHWTAGEQSAFQSAMALWSAVADVHFTQVSSGGDFVITRGSDGEADAGQTRLVPGAIGSATLGHPSAASLSIDTSVAGFGPVGGAFKAYGGYPWMTVEHELGHILGLGHTGAYDEGQTATTPSYGPYDTRAYSLMSYLDPPADTFGWTVVDTAGASEEGSPVTPQMFDILALQRIYGLPTDTPLFGGQVFGFHDNIAGPVGAFFDFSQNTQPIVTLWDAGGNNTLDLSGFSQAAHVDLHAGSFSSVGGLRDNVAIAYDTHIDEAIGGSGADDIVGNEDADSLFGGGGDDVLIGGATPSVLFGGRGDDQLTGAGYLSGDLGNDTLKGLGTNDTLLGGDGDDHIEAAGHSWAFGNQGDDSLFGDGAATLFGGQGADQLTDGDSVGGFFFGNMGDDLIQVSGSATIFGGQGDDLIQSSGLTGQYLSGDIGADTILGGGGADTIVGGPGADLLTGDDAGSDPSASASLLPPSNTDAHAGDRFLYFALSDSAPGAADRITDFNPAEDSIDISAIDSARASAGQTLFHWATSFNGGAGEAVLSYDAASNTTTLALDADGDKAADFLLFLHGDVAPGPWLLF